MGEMVKWYQQNYLEYILRTPANPIPRKLSF
jgi:hypothetical protein